MVRWQRPSPPRNPESLADAWVTAQGVMPEGRWLALTSEYGESAWWVASAAASQEFDPFDVLGIAGEGPEAALVRLADDIVRQRVGPAIVEGVTSPAAGQGGHEFGEAWRMTIAALPDGWWITGVVGYEGRSDPPGWFAFAAGGPDNGYAGKQGSGATPEAALLASAAAVRTR